MSIYKRNGRYWINISFNKRRYRKPSPENSSAGAKAYELVLRQKLSRGESVSQEPDKEVVKMPTFKEFSQKWFEVYVKTNNKHSEILNKESLLRAHLNPFFGEKKLDKITALDIESYKSSKSLSGQSPKSVNNHLIVLNKCFNSAKDWEIIKKSPKIKLLKVPPQSFDFLTSEECEALIENSDGMLRDLIIIALKTGLRFGELIALEHKNVNLQDKILTVHQSISRGKLGSTKSNKIRYIPLFDETSAVFAERKGDKGFIFSLDNKEPLNPPLCLRWLHKACDKAGLRKIGWHTLRHTFASHLVQRGVSIVVIQSLLGHADVKTTMRYSHLSDGSKREAIKVLNKNNCHNAVTISNFDNNNYLNVISSQTEIAVKD